MQGDLQKKKKKVLPFKIIIEIEVLYHLKSLSEIFLSALCSFNNNE